MSVRYSSNLSIEENSRVHNTTNGTTHVEVAGGIPWAMIILFLIAIALFIFLFALFGQNSSTPEVAETSSAFINLFCDRSSDVAACLEALK